MRRQGFLAASIDAALLRKRDALALTLADQRALERCKGSHHRQHERRHRRVLAGEGQVLLDELDAEAALDPLLHEAAQVIEVAREAIHVLCTTTVTLSRTTRAATRARAVARPCPKPGR
jgi:hypothetical protein